jgi:SNF2 family DNA or RNA helicase
VHHGSERTKRETFFKEIEGKAIVITSYALLHRDFDAFKEVQWGGVILDEAQYIKNAETKQAKAAHALQADYKLALTGTPVENNVGDLWSIMQFINPGLLGSQKSFRESFFKPIQHSGSEKAANKLKQLTSPFILRRLKTDKSIIQDLPDKIESKVYCSLSKEQASLYSATVEEATRLLETLEEGIMRRGVILSTLTKLKQICNHPAQFLKDNNDSEERSGKMVHLTEILGGIAAHGEHALIFTQFTEMGTLLKGHLEETLGQEVLFLHGQVPKKARDKMVVRFQEEERGPKIFILSLKAGGTGLNLTRANHVFHFDRWWNPAVENQATDRAFRIGQKKNVQVHKYICSGTLEETIDEMIENKKAVASTVIGTGEGWLTELSTEQLSELWKLKQEVV